MGLTPNLTELTLRGVRNQFSGHKLIYGRGFHDLGALKSLTVDDALGEDLLALAPKSLEYLSIYFNLRMQYWTRIHRLASLQTLVLHGRFNIFTGYLVVYDLPLPLLHTIAFIGELDKLHLINFHCPSLHHIAFVPKHTHGHCELASLQPKTISWGIFEGIMTKWTDIAVKGMVKKILLYYRMVESLDIPEYAEKPVREVIEELRNAQSLPKPPKVLLVSSSGHVRSISLLSE